MNLGNCTVTIDGERFEATSVRMDYNPDNIPTATVTAVAVPPKYEAEVQLASEETLHEFGIKWPNATETRKRLAEEMATINKKERDMCYEDKECVDTGYSGDRLAAKMRNLELEDDERLLRRHGILEIDGTLTRKGKDFLLNVVLDGYKDDVVTALKEIDAADKEERKA